MQLNTETKKLAMAQLVVGRAMRAGATDAEAVVVEGDEFYTKVRLGQVETLTESTSRAIGLRVFNGLRTASTSTNDFSEESIRRMIDGAEELAKITEEDPFAGLPDSSEYSTVRTGDTLGIYFQDVYDLPASERIEMARATEAAAMAADVRIQNSDGGTFTAATSYKAIANSRGFAGEYRKSYCGIGCAPIAQDASGRPTPLLFWSDASGPERLEGRERREREDIR